MNVFELISNSTLGGVSVPSNTGLKVSDEGAIELDSPKSSPLVGTDANGKLIDKYYTGDVDVLLSPDADPSKDNDNIKTQILEIINGVAIANRTPVFHINSAMKIARYFVGSSHDVTLWFKDGTYEYSAREFISDLMFVKLAPLVTPQTRVGISTRSVTFNFSSGQLDIHNCAYVSVYGIKIVCNASADACIFVTHSSIDIYGCVFDGGSNGIDGRRYHVILRSWLLGENRTYVDTLDSSGNKIVDTETAIETYFTNQSASCLEVDMLSGCDFVGWIRFNHNTTKEFAIIVATQSFISRNNSSYPVRLDIYENGTYGLVLREMSYVQFKNMTIRCNKSGWTTFSNVAQNDLSVLNNGYVETNNMTYTKVTDPLS